MSKPLYLTKTIAAERLGLSVRRLLELSLRGELRRHYVRDPLTKRRQTVFAAGDVQTLELAMHRRMNPMAVRRSGGNMPDAAAVKHLPAPSAPPAPVVLERPWITVAEAALRSGLPEKTVSRLIQSGQLPALDTHSRNGGRWRIHREQLDALRGQRIR